MSSAAIAGSTGGRLPRGILNLIDARSDPELFRKTSASILRRSVHPCPVLTIRVQHQRHVIPFQRLPGYTGATRSSHNHQIHPPNPENTLVDSRRPISLRCTTSRAGPELGAASHRRQASAGRVTASTISDRGMTFDTNSGAGPVPRLGHRPVSLKRALRLVSRRKWLPTLPNSIRAHHAGATHNQYVVISKTTGMVSDKKDMPRTSIALSGTSSITP